MQLYLPNSAFLGNIESFISKLEFGNDDQLTISMNPKWVSVHPIVLSATAALALECRNKNIPIHIGNATPTSLPYFVRMGLYEFLGQTQPLEIQTHEESGRFIPLRQITSSDQLSEFIRDMIPLLHASPENADPIKYVVSELIRNVIEHAHSTVGAIICAQYFKKTKRISIGVADRGIGIANSIRVSHTASDDIAAINLALRPGITGTTARIGGTEYNAGAGLFFTRNIAKASQNFFFIHSGSGYFKQLTKISPVPAGQLELFSDPFSDPCTVRKNVANWNGTLVGIDIATEGGADFTQLLDEIRTAYSTDVKSRKKQKYKKPRFA